jgi:carbonic anhydrase
MATDERTSVEEKLERLRAGNRRYVANQSERNITASDRRDLATRQRPFAVVLGCSDSRVPIEVVFDQGIGDLFVIRVAGNIVQPSQIGSVEFAAQKFDTRLVVVLGHTQCGAIEATIDELQQPAERQSRNIASIVNCIRPSVESLLGQVTTREALILDAVRANIRYSVEALRHGSAILESLIDEARLLIVGAEYSLESGVVTFFDSNG